MTLFQCPIGHPPGPQEFCPICGRRCDPVGPPAAAPPPEPPVADAPTSSWESVRSEALSEPEQPAPFDLDAPVEGSPPPPALPPAPPPFPTGPPVGAPPPSPFAPAPPTGGPPPSPFAPGPPLGEPTGPAPSAEGDDASGGAAAKARDLIAELSGGKPAGSAPTIPSQPPGGPSLPPAPPDSPAAPFLPSGGPVPSFGHPGHGGGPDIPAPIPSYAPTEPPGLGFPPPLPADLPAELPADQPTGLSPDLPGDPEDEPPTPGQWSDGSAPPVPVRSRRSRGGGDTDDAAPSRASGSPRLPVLLLLLVVLAGAAYLVWSQLLNTGSDTTSTVPPVRSSASAKATTAPTVTKTLSAAELAASLKDAHFKHGYDWGKLHGKAPAADREQVCRTEALKQRAGGYPWGAHDRAGCLVAVSGG